MNIRYIQSNISQVSKDNLIKFLYDLVLQEIKDITNYQPGANYYKGDKVYLQENGKHQIFQCLVDKSSTEFVNDEWIYIMETYEGTVEKCHNLKIKEEVHIIDETNRHSIKTQILNNSKHSTLAVYCGKKRYSINHDFTINGNEIKFINPFNIGDRIILEVRESIGVIPILVGIVLYDLNKVPYKVYIDENKVINIEKIKVYDSLDVKFAELVTGDMTYTLLVDGGSTPYELKAYRRIETYITGTNDEIYNVIVENDVLTLKRIDSGIAYSDTKIILGLDKKFYTLSSDDNVIIATEYIDDSLDPNNFELGVKVISQDFKNRMICINDGHISLMPYVDNGGYHNINFVDLKTNDVIRLSVNDDKSLVMYDGLDDEGYSGTRLLDYFYFFDDEWNYNRMFVENGNLLFETCDFDVVPDSKGINLLKKDGEMVKIKIPYQGDGIHVISCISMSDTGTFESPIEGFVVKINDEVKLVTVNKQCNGFEIVDTDLPFRTNHHYILSTDNKLYKLVIFNNSASFVEIINDEYNNEIVLIDAGENYYYINTDDKDFNLVKSDKIVSDDKICTIVIEYKDSRYRFMEVDGILTFVKTQEVFDNERAYVNCIDDPSKIYYFTISNESFYCNKINNESNNIVCEYDIECMVIGAFIKSNEIITRFDIIDGDNVFKPISTFKHNIKGTNNKTYELDVIGEPTEEKLLIKEIKNSNNGQGNLYIKDINGTYYRGFISNGELQFKETDPITNVDYNITSIISTSKGLYNLILDNGIIKLEKIFDNMFEDISSYGNIVKKSFNIPAVNGKYYSVSANGLGEIIFKNVDIIVDNSNVLLKSNDGFNYGLGLVNNILVTYTSYSSTDEVKDALFIKDTNNGYVHKLYMENDRLCSTIVNSDVYETTIVLCDNYKNKYKIEMHNNILSVTSL